MNFTLATPIGRLRIALDDEECVVETSFVDAGEDEHVDHPVAKALEAYFAGDVAALDGIAVSIPGDGFRARAQRALREIPAGTTISYAQLAAAAGSPNATRAAGSACATNPVGVIVPCHRVVRTAGALGGYAGGLDRKTWLLEHERRHAL